MALPPDRPPDACPCRHGNVPAEMAGQRPLLERAAACLSIQKLTGGTRAAPPAPEAQTSSAEEFERRLGPRDVDSTGSDPALAAALTVARSLRQATPGSMASPDPELVDQLRHEVVREPQQPEVPDSAFSRLFKRPWVATAVATAGIVVVLALQAFGKPAPPGTCDGRPCPASTTVAVAAAGDNSVGTPLSTVL